MSNIQAIALLSQAIPTIAPETWTVHFSVWEDKANTEITLGDCRQAISTFFSETSIKSFPLDVIHAVGSSVVAFARLRAMVSSGRIQITPVSEIGKRSPMLGQRTERLQGGSQ